jgi:serine phosphatase RsbU (regulator of sigma subunit)
LFAGARYDLHTAKLSPGDAVLFATDGLHELCNHDGMEFDTSEINRICRQRRNKSADEFLAFLFEDMSAFSDGASLHDDATALVLKVQAGPG